MAKKTDYNYLHDAPVTAHIYAKWANGQFLETTTGLPLELKEGASVRLTVPLAALPDAMQDQFKTEARTILPAGSELLLHLPNTDYVFYIGLQHDLNLVSKNNKEAIATGGRFLVYRARDSRREEGLHDFEPFEENSLNQVYFRLSMKYRPKSRSHNGNVYKHFREAKSGRLLETYRF